jgi:hypothetical protein
LPKIAKKVKIMSVRAVSEYLNNVLSPQLTGYGVSPQFVERIFDVVETQMCSTLLHWRDVAFRKALLLIASEEGTFYEPAAKADVKCFVVVTLRNSPFESLQSDSHEACGLAEALSDGRIKAVTSAAITYFNRLDFDALSREAQLSGGFADIYGELSKRAPVAWNALTSIAASSSKRVVFAKLEVSEPYRLDCARQSVDESITEHKAFLDGYSSEIDPLLAQRLSAADSGRCDLYIDCFKMLTRNVEKLLSVMEYLLTRGSAVVTINYYIENGYAERRTKIIRAASSRDNGKEADKHALLTAGLGVAHARAIKAAQSK